MMRMSFRETFSSSIKAFYRSIIPERKIPGGFWKITREDYITGFAMLFMTISVWTATLFTGPFSSVYCYWDGPNYVFAAITLYDISRDNPWTKYFHYDPSYFACHLPGFPLVIRFFAFFTLGNYILADLMAIVFCSLLLCYVFRRVLLSYNCVSDPTISTILLAFIPMRLVIYHSVGASEPLFIAEICFAMIFYKYNQTTQLLFAIWACCVTRIEGMEVGAVFGFCYLLRMDIFRALLMFLTFLAPAGLLLFHKAMFGDALAYINFNKGKQGLISSRPFPELRPERLRTPDTNYLHSFLDFYPLYVIGAILVLVKAGPIGLLCCIHLAYVALLNHMDLYRYSLPAGVFCLLIGLDDLWTDARVRFALRVIAPVYWIEMMLYAAGQIHSNQCGMFFMKEVLDAAKDKIH